MKLTSLSTRTRLRISLLQAATARDLGPYPRDLVTKKQLARRFVKVVQGVEGVCCWHPSQIVDGQGRLGRQELSRTLIAHYYVKDGCSGVSRWEKTAEIGFNFVVDEDPT